MSRGIVKNEGESILVMAGSELILLAATAEKLQQKISFADYLLHENYQMLSPRLFVKDDSPEIIRLTKKDGETVFKNFAIKEDKGNLMDFIRNRSYEPGKIVPNKKIAPLEIAVAKAQSFLDNHSVPVKPKIRKRELLEDSGQAMRR